MTGTPFRYPRVPRSLPQAALAVLLLFAAHASVAQTIFSSGFEYARPIWRGGSNFIWYTLGDNCDREPFGIIPNYHEAGVRELVRSQLIDMRAAGQENLSLGLYHLRAGNIVDSVGRFNGTLMDSTGGNLHPRMRQNLVEFLADIRETGFSSIVFRYHPQGANNPRTWESLGGSEQSLLEENWSLIRNLELILQQSGLDWGTDLLVEGMPRAYILEVLGNRFIDPDRPHMEGWSRYAREIWRRYSNEFGVARTFGFSFVSDTDDVRIDARVEHKDYVYTVDGQLRLPVALALDIYGTPQRDEAWIFRAYHRHLVDEGLGAMPWIIAESYFNDAAAAEAFASAMTTTGQSVFYLTQWPLQRGSTCSPDVTEAPPVGFSNYARFGF